MTPFLAASESASGASMLKDGKPDLENEAVVGTLDYIKQLNDAGNLTINSSPAADQLRTSA